MLMSNARSWRVVRQSLLVVSLVMLALLILPMVATAQAPSLWDAERVPGAVLELGHYGSDLFLISYGLDNDVGGPNSLEITKNVEWNGMDPDVNQEFTICIEGPSFPPTGGVVGDPDPADACQVVGYEGGVITWTNLAAGTYAITEDVDTTRWAKTILPEQVVMGVSTPSTAVVNNARKVTGLSVTKTVNWRNVDVDQTQEFTICIEGPSFPAAGGVVGDPTPADACQVVTYAGGTVTWYDLVPGTYTVTEQADEIWEVTILPEQAVVTAEVVTPVSVVNDRFMGELQIAKVPLWLGVEPDPAKEFTICIQGPSFPDGSTVVGTPDPISRCQTVGHMGGIITWTNLIPGEYVISEEDPGDEWIVTVLPKESVVVTGVGTAMAVVNNTRELGDLEVTKVVNWIGIDPDPTEEFTICIEGPSFPAGGGVVGTPDPISPCQKVGYMGGLVSWSDLVPGTYTITEQASDFWEELIVPEQVDVTTTEPALATVTNLREGGDLTVTKVVSWGGDEPDTSQTFTICIEGPSFPDGASGTPEGEPDPMSACQVIDYDGGAVSWSNLLPGIYSVTEEIDDSEWSSLIVPPAMLVSEGIPAQVLVTNAKGFGDLRVTKTVEWNGVTPTAGEVFSICIVGPSFPLGDCKEITLNTTDLTYEVAWTDLIPGEYVVAELWTSLEYWVPVIQPLPTTTVVAGQEAQTSITNYRANGQLLVAKEVSWMGNEPDVTKQFTVCIAGPSYPDGDEEGACRTFDWDGGVAFWDDIEAGWYTITEENPGDEWLATVLPPMVLVPELGEVVLPPVPALVTNVRKTGALTVTKVVDWNGVTPDPEQEFEICIAGPSFPGGFPVQMPPPLPPVACQTVGHEGGMVGWLDLIPGVYTITETTLDEWETVIVSEQVTLPDKGGIVGATVTNTHRLGNLVVNKVVDWNGADPNDAQEFEICIEGPSYPDGDCKTIGYKGGPLLWEDLLPGEYTVTETASAGWEIVHIDETIEVSADGSKAQGAVENRQIVGALGNYVWYDAVNNDAQDAGEPGFPTVLVELYDGVGNLLDSMFTDSTGYYLFDKLPAGTYRVKFHAPAGYAIVLTDQADDALDSDADPSTGETGLITLDPGEIDLTIDAGLILEFGGGIPELDVTKTEWHGTCQGWRQRYTIRVSNVGELPMYNLEVVDSLPPDDMVDPLLDQSSEGAVHDPLANTVTWIIPTVAPGQSVELYLEIRVWSSAPAGELLINCVDIWSAAGVQLWNICNETVIENCDPPPAPTPVPTATPTPTATPEPTVPPQRTRLYLPVIDFRDWSRY